MIVALFTTRRLTAQLGQFFEIRAAGRSRIAAKLGTGSRVLLSYLEKLFDGRFPSRLAVLIMCMFLLSLGAIRVRHLYEGTESPLETIARIAGSSESLHDETILGLALPPDYEDGIAGPAAMFYSARPIYVAWSEEELYELTANGPREIMMGEKDIATLANRYEFSILAKSPPYVYSVIRQRETPVLMDTD